MEDPLVTRDELSHTLFAILDISRDVHRIRTIFEEEDDGEDWESDC